MSILSSDRGLEALNIWNKKYKNVSRPVHWIDDGFIITPCGITPGNPQDTPVVFIEMDEFSLKWRQKRHDFEKTKYD